MEMVWEVFKNLQSGAPLLFCVKEYPFDLFEVLYCRLGSVAVPVKHLILNLCFVLF